MPIYEAELGEIIRAERRDEKQLNYLREEFSSIAKVYFEGRKYGPTIFILNLLFLGIQTLGEELSYLLQFTKGPNRRPSAFRRIVFFIFHFLFPFFVEKELYLIEDSLNNLSFFSFLIYFSLILNILRSIGIPLLYHTHLAIFYTGGIFRSLSNRLTGIRYLSLRPQTNIQVCLLFCSYKNIILTAIQSSLLSIIFLSILSNFFQFYSTFICSICLNCQFPICTPCGHLLCWDCIFAVGKAARNLEQEYPKCPHCRSAIILNRIVPILNL
ncbi:unnamed protein product [Dracunculus medinensis]|uniref:RING-type E3 ubiquitin transferase n=1 Tax=Dracunculus medinensis TaxID=318479 RepID=A0A0N4UL42_DRAME|nr:unnamed protein product [Dracunculus medinensis]